MRNAIYDAVVIGGGITGCGVARDLAGQGLSVALCERNDLASGTSSASTKLIHGGLRYLEQAEFRLVREALAERETLLRIAPHLVTAMRFVLPDVPKLRSRWLIGAGLFLYDHLAGRKSLQASGRCALNPALFQSVYRAGFFYADGWADDSRLVIANAKDAAQRGADIYTRTAVTNIQQQADHWVITTQTGVFIARAVVNAAGPWARHVLDQSNVHGDAPPIRWVQGSHLIVRLALPDRTAFMLQQPDRRIVFLIPFDDHYSLIGTTERDCPIDDNAIGITQAETDYLLTAVNRYLVHPITPNHIVHRYSGVRPIIGTQGSDARTASRDYKIVQGTGAQAGVISIFGGKLTTYRVMAAQAARRVTAYLGHPYRDWTASDHLAGGDLGASFDKWVQSLIVEYPAHPPARIQRWAATYGTDARHLLGQDPRTFTELGADLSDREIDYLMDTEWAQTADDVLWRRTKQGLGCDTATQARIDDYIRIRRGE